MMLSPLTTHRMNMMATILKQGAAAPQDIDIEEYGNWVNHQDPLTGQIIRIWEPVTVVPDDELTEEVDETLYQNIRCAARGIVDGGIRVAGTTERWQGGEFANIDFVKLWTPRKTVLTKRDRVTNIRSRNGQILFWVDEEAPDATPRATVFNVNGTTPLYDALNRHVENFTLLERAETW